MRRETPHLGGSITSPRIHRALGVLRVKAGSSPTKDVVRIHTIWVVKLFYILAGSLADRQQSVKLP